MLLLHFFFFLSVTQLLEGTKCTSVIFCSNNPPPGVINFSSGPEQISVAFNGTLFLARTVTLLDLLFICMKNQSDLILLQFSMLARTLNESPAVLQYYILLLFREVENPESLYRHYLLNPIYEKMKLSGEEHYLKWRFLLRATTTKI